MLHRTLSLAAALAASLSAQTLVTPAAANAADLNSSTGYPFDYASAIRVIYTMDSSHFTGQSVSAPILISQMRVRANGATTTWTGSSINNLTVDVSTSPLDWSAMSTTFDNNHGPDRARVWNGPLSWGAGSATTGTPGPWVWDIAFATPFLYDPNAGDLAIDFLSSGTLSTTQTPSVDAATTTGVALGKRVYGLNYTGSATGSLQSGEIALAVEFTYSLAAGYASSSAFGAGCYDRASSVYESFTGANFDLNGAPTNSLRFLPNAAGGFTVLTGSNVFFTPTSADLLLTDDSLSGSLALPFAFPFGAISTSAVKICSNGFLWLLDTETSTDLSPTVAELLTRGPRIAPFWDDLNPAAVDPVTLLRLGSIHSDVDPITNNPVFTWLNVPEFGSTVNLNTFQIELEPSGAFEVRWQTTAVTATDTILTGVSFGLGVRDGGPIDLSAAVPFSTAGDAKALRLGASARPTLGTTFDLVTSEIPSNAGFGIMVFGFQQYVPGFDLTSVGAPGCYQHVWNYASAGYLVTPPSFAVQMTYPAVPMLAGVHVFAQSAVLSTGVNSVGVLTSNGIDLLLDVN